MPDRFPNNRQADSPLGMLSDYLRTQWSERERETGRPMGIQNVAALSTLEFLKPPPVFDESGNITPEALEMMVMGSLGQRAPGKQPEFIREAKQSLDKLRSAYAHKSELPSLIRKQQEYFERPFVKGVEKKELGELKGFVEDWFADPSHKVRYEDLFGKRPGSVNLPREHWLDRPASSSPFTQKNIFEEVGKRVDKMRETDVEEIFRYVEEMSGSKYTGQFFPPGSIKRVLEQPNPGKVGAPYYKTQQGKIWEKLPESIKKLGTIEVATGPRGRSKSIPIHEFTHMAEGGWYGQNLHHFTRKHMNPKFKHTISSEGNMTRNQFYISKPEEILARVMELRHEWFTRPMGMHKPASRSVRQFKPVGDDFIKYFKERRNQTYETLREIYSEKNLKHIVNKLPSIAAVTAAQELIGQQGNATSK